MIHPVVCNPVLGPLVGVKDPVRWLAGRGYPSGAILHFDANTDPYTEQTGGPHTFNHAILSPQYQRNADGSYTDVGAKPAVDVFDGEKWLRSCGAVTNLLPSGAEDLTASSWIKRGTAAVAAGNLVSGIGPGDVYSVIAELTANTSLTPSIEIKRVSTTGVLSIQNSGGVSCGRWDVDLSLLSDDYEKITSDHPSVSIINAFVVSPGGVSGLHFWYRSGVSPLSFYARNPQLTATPYPVPYVPPGTTQPASNATTTNGCWFTLPDGSPMWKALDGDVSGVELLSTARAPVNDDGGCAGVYNPATKTLSNTAVGTNSSYPRFMFDMGAKTIGARYKCRIEFSDISKVSNMRLAVSGGTQLLTKVGNAYVGTITADNTSNILEIQLDGRFIFSTQIISATVQRIQPQPLTLATRVRMGTGSADWLTGVAVYPFYVSQSEGGYLQYSFLNRANIYAVTSNDGAVSANTSPTTWPRNAIIRRVTQVNAAGTQFRVGYMIEGTHTTIQWGSWEAFDGSFSPSTLYRLMLGHNNPYPMWFNKITAWKEQVSDALIMEAMA